MERTMKKEDLVGIWSDLTDYDVTCYKLNLTSRNKGIIEFHNWGFCWAYRFRWELDDSTIKLTNLKRCNCDSIVELSDAYILVKLDNNKLKVLDTNLDMFSPEDFSRSTEKSSI